MCLNPDCHVYKEQLKNCSLTWDLFGSISFPRYILWSKLHIWSGISQRQCDRCETYWSVTSYAGSKKDSACNLEKERMKFYIHFYAKQVPLVWQEPRYSALFINLSDKLIAWRRYMWKHCPMCYYFWRVTQTRSCGISFSWGGGGGDLIRLIHNTDLLLCTQHRLIYNFTNSI